VRDKEKMCVRYRCTHVGHHLCWWYQPEYCVLSCFSKILPIPEVTQWDEHTDTLWYVHTGTQKK